MSVYFAQVGQYIKIGYSQNPERRVRRLFSGATSAPVDCPRDLASRHLIRYIDGTKDDEFQIHQALDDFRVCLEYFADEPEVREYIATVQTAEHYPTITRAAGPAYIEYRERTKPTPEEEEQLRRALDSMFKRPVVNTT